MACAAILLGVRAFQRKCGFTVVEAIVFPGGRDMALCTGFVGIPFFGNLPVMHIFMTIYAAHAKPFEFPFVILFVAGKTRRGNMRAIQREFGLGMLLQTICTFCKTLYRVARCTIRCNDDAGKLPLMVIFVAGSTSIMRQRIGHMLRFMAFFTVNGLVFAFQRITGLVVVKSIQISHFSERVFLVAIHTFVAESVVVHILVAGNTIVCRHADPVLKNIQWRCGHGMAFPAIHLLVFPFQGEFGGIVVKFIHADPIGKGLVVVAIFAVVSEIVIVRVFVATVAVFERHI